MRKSQQSALRRLAVTTLVTIACAGSAVTAQAAYVVNATEAGGDVVFEGSGSFNLQAWTFDSTFNSSSTFLDPGRYLLMGSTQFDVYSAASLSGPSTIGPGAGVASDSEAGPYVGIDWIAEELRIPIGYVSGDQIPTSTMTFTNDTFLTLGITPGTYEWSWGSGATADSLTLNVGAVPVPAAVWLFGSGLLGLVGVARRKARA